MLTIAGSNFLGTSPADTVVSFDSGAGVAADTVRGNLLQVTLPATLAAGTRTVRVQRMVTFPRSTAPHQGFSSSPAPFQLIPVIQAPVPQATPGSPLTLTLTPAVGRTQQATLYIGDTAIPIDERPVTGPASSATHHLPDPGGLPGRNLSRPGRDRRRPEHAHGDRRRAIHPAGAGGPVTTAGRPSAPDPSPCPARSTGYTRSLTRTRAGSRRVQPG